MNTFLSRSNPKRFVRSSQKNSSELEKKRKGDKINKRQLTLCHAKPVKKSESILDVEVKKKKGKSKMSPN